MGDTLYLYTERRTVKARNLAADPRLVVHLESAQHVLIEEDRQYLPAADPAFNVV